MSVVGLVQPQVCRVRQLNVFNTRLQDEIRFVQRSLPSRFRRTGPSYGSRALSASVVSEKGDNRTRQRVGNTLRSVVGLQCFRHLKISCVRDSSVMFEATCHQFCQSVGRDSLVPVYNLDISDNVQPFQVVVKTVKRHYIFWEKAKYRPTEFKVSLIAKT